MQCAGDGLAQQVCVGELPWLGTGVAVDLGSTIGPLKKRMGLVALEIRAARQEKQLVLFEMRSLIASYDKQCRAVSAAMVTAIEELQRCEEQQDEWYQVLTQQQQQQQEVDQVTTQRALKQSENMAKVVAARLELLQREIDAIEQKQQLAEKLFAPYLQPGYTSDSALAASDAELLADEMLTGDLADDEAEAAFEAAEDAADTTIEDDATDTTLQTENAAAEPEGETTGLSTSMSMLQLNHTQFTLLLLLQLLLQLL